MVKDSVVGQSNGQNSTMSKTQAPIKTVNATPKNSEYFKINE